MSRLPNRSLALIQLCEAFETLTPENVNRLMTCYAEHAEFKDPFNEVKGQEAIIAIFRHMFTQVNSPRFTIITTVEQGNQAFITWHFNFIMTNRNSTLECIRGSSHIIFDDAGKVTLHRDYWDAAEELYEKIPLLGGFMRFLKKSASH